MCLAVLPLLLALLLTGEEIDPSAVEWFRKGEELIGTDKEGSALQAEYFEKAVEVAPDFVAARFNLALVYLRQNRLDEALDQLNPLAQLDPGSVRVLQMRAQVYGKRGEMGLAIADLDQATRLAPEDYEVWQALGFFLYREQRLEEALVAFEKVLRLSPSTAGAYFDIALVQQGLGKLADAADSFRRFLAVHPEDPQANFLLGLVCRQQGENDQALQYFLEAEALSPDDPDVAIELSNLYLELGNLREAEKRVAKGRETSAERLFSLGIVAKNKQDWAEAARYFREALKKEPENSSIWTQLGDVLAQQGKKKEAARAYEVSIEYDPDEFASLLNLATLYAQKRPREALELLEHAIELQPDSGLAHLNLALLHESLGSDSEAQAHYLVAIEQGVSEPNVHFRLAILFAKQSQIDAALEHLAIAFEGDAERFVPLVLSELRNVNSDLDSIRYTKGFNELLKRYRKQDASQ